MIYAGRFAGRNAIITGGASGLGLEAAKRITAEGGKVSLWDLNPDSLAAAKLESQKIPTVLLGRTDFLGVVRNGEETNGRNTAIMTSMLRKQLSPMKSARDSGSLAMLQIIF